MQHEPRSRCDPAQPTGLPKQARGRPRGSQIGPPPRWLPGAAAQPRGAAAQLLSQLLPCFRHGFRTSKLQSRSRAAAAQSPGSTPTSVPHTQLLRAAPRAVLQLPRLPPAQQARALPPQTPSRAASRQPARLHTCQARLPGRPSVRRTESCLHPHGTSTYEARLLSCPSWATIVGAHRGRPSWAPIVPRACYQRRHHYKRCHLQILQWSSARSCRDHDSPAARSILTHRSHTDDVHHRQCT